MAAWTTLPFLMFGAGGLTVDTPSPDALCPPLEQTRSVVASRLGNVELEGTWRATYVLVHREQGDLVALTLRDPSGVLRLVREFSATGGTCATLAQVIALVLERYFLRSETSIDGSTTSPGDAKKGDTGPAHAGLDRRPLQGKATQPVPATTPASKSIRPPTARNGLDAGLWVSTAWVAPTAGFSVRALGPWSLGLRGGYDLTDHESPISIGWGTSRRIPLALTSRRKLFDAARLRLDLGADLLVLYERVQTMSLVEDGAASRFVPGFGLSIGAEFLPNRPSMGPFVELSSAMLLRWLSRPFEIDQQPAFALPTFVVGMHFGIRTIL